MVKSAPMTLAKIPQQRPFLKWAGGKYRLLHQLKSLLPAGNTFIEPFLGSGAVFLNTDYQNYSLNDTNQTLIQLYRLLQREGSQFIEETKQLFTANNNTADQYYRFRAQFNESSCLREKAILFVYLNRHGYNGLCRFNRRGLLNVPFGRYKKPYFPEKEMHAFYQKSAHAEFHCSDFAVIMQSAKPGDVIYCDPPYVPLSTTAQFTQYHSTRFAEDEQYRLAQLAASTAKKGVTVILSNHDTPFTRQIYQHARLHYFPVRRLISCKANTRAFCNELVAVFSRG